MRSTSNAGRQKLHALLAAVLALCRCVNATLLVDLNPALPKAAVTDIGQLDYDTCPVQFPSCTGFANPGAAKVFYVNNSRYTFDKPAHFDRAEVHGLKNHIFVDNKTYFLGWDFSLSGFPRVINCAGQTPACTVESNRIFQFHTFGSPNTLNIPLQVYLNPTAPGAPATAIVYGMTIKGSTRTQIPLFVTPPLVAGTIYPIILAIHTSRIASVGSVQVWWGGKLQTLKTGGTILHLQTWDGVSVDPKWGVYGAWASALKTTVGRIRLGTTLADVLP